MNTLEEGACKSPEIMALVSILYFCVVHNNFNVCVQHIPCVRNYIVDAFSSFQHHRFIRIAPNANHHSDIIPAWLCRSLHCRLLHCRYYGVPSQLGEHTNQVLKAYLLFCSHFNITPTPASSLTLQYFYMNKSQSVSYKTLKVYVPCCYPLDAYRKWLYRPDY